MNLLREARESIATTLRDAPALSAVNVYAAPPAQITVPAVVIAATESPWVAVRTIEKYAVTLTLIVAVAQGASNATNLDALEEVVVAVLSLFPQAIAVSGVEVNRSGQTDIVQVEIPVSVLVQEG